VSMDACRSPIARGFRSSEVCSPPQCRRAFSRGQERFRELTPAQRQVAALLSAGYQAAEIATKRHITRELVDAQIAQTLAMLQARAPSELRAIAARRIERLPLQARERAASTAANEDAQAIARQLRREAAALHDRADRLSVLAERIAGTL